MQIGFLFLPEKLMPDLTRLDPLKGFGRIFSLANFVHLLFGIFKIALIGTVAYVCLWKQKETILGLTGLSVPEIAAFLPETLLWISIKIAFALLVLALLDYGFQWWKHEQDLRMTSQEIREEMKNLEGNPQVISRRKQVQRQLAMNRLSTAVPKADVVITNPTELAVAIQYDPDGDGRADRGGQRGGRSRQADPQTGLGKRHADRRKETARPSPLPRRRYRQAHPLRKIRRRRRSAGLRLSAQRQDDPDAGKEVKRMNAEG